MIQVLAELQSVYSLYQPLWHEWTRYIECGMSHDEIYTVNVHVHNKFKVRIEEAMMFYNKPALIIKLTLKLKMKFKAYKEWVVERFIASLIYKGRRYSAELFFSLPIKRLIITAELKQVLLNLSVDKLSIILELHMAKKLTRSIPFTKIAACQAVLLKEEKRSLKYKAEVIRDI